MLLRGIWKTFCWASATIISHANIAKLEDLGNRGAAHNQIISKMYVNIVKLGNGHT